jgi:C-terminal processing protease CtpA/Prc
LLFCTAFLFCNGANKTIVGKNIGYIRVSSFDQNTERQLDGIDKASGKDVQRQSI